MRLFRLFKIFSVGVRFGLYEFALDHERARPLRTVLDALSLKRRYKTPRAVRASTRASWSWLMKNRR